MVNRFCWFICSVMPAVCRAPVSRLEIETYTDRRDSCEIDRQILYGSLWKEIHVFQVHRNSNDRGDRINSSSSGSSVSCKV